MLPCQSVLPKNKFFEGEPFCILLDSAKQQSQVRWLSPASYDKQAKGYFPTLALSKKQMKNKRKAWLFFSFPDQAPFQKNPGDPCFLGGSLQQSKMLSMSSLSKEHLPINIYFLNSRRVFCYKDTVLNRSKTQREQADPNKGK